jgi:CRP-like cAMP-binding protein
MASGGVKKLGKGDILFREGDPSDSMYVIKTGRIAITKAKGSGEIILAEKAGGEMLGEMGFFDNKPRSAGAKAVQDAEVIQLPFSSLHAQFKTFPEWLKAMVKTINAHLREANTRIKNLEAAANENAEMFPPHLITRLCALISLIGYKCGEKAESGGLVIPYGVLRDYCIQIFQQPTNKLDKIMEVLQALNLMKVEDLGEGRKRVTIVNHKVLTDFTDWYNKYLFTEQAKRVTVEEKEMPTLRALCFYGAKLTPDDQGIVKVSLTEMQNNSMRDLNTLFGVNDADSLAEKGLVQEKQSEQGGTLSMKFKLSDLTSVQPFWEIIYTLKKVPSRR